MSRTPAWKNHLQLALRLCHLIPGVTGIDYGRVYKSGQRLKTLGIRFHVHNKLPLSDLKPAHVLPNKIEGLRCDVLEAKYSLTGSPREVCSPIEPGVSIGNLERGSTGTLGLIVRDTGRKAIAILSNWHILCASPAAKIGELITQPGPQHLGSIPPRLIGRLERWVPLNAGLDAAVALLDPGVDWQRGLFGSFIDILGTEPPQIGMQVIKYGATSGLTYAQIDGINGSYEIDYSGYGGPVRWMDGVRLIPDPDHQTSEITLAGDSGAVWVNTKTGKAVALHFAGEDATGPMSEYALAHSLQKVMSLLDIELA